MIEQIIQFLQSNIFSVRIDLDERHEILLFESIPLIGVEEAVGLRLPSSWFWLQLFVNLILQTIFVATCGFIVYKVIIPNRKSPLAFLTCYGIVIPLLLLYPFYAIKYLVIRNKFVRFMNGLVPLLAIFRTTAVTHNFSQPGSESSLSIFLLSYLAIGVLSFDSHTKLPLPPKSHIIQTFKKFLIAMLTLALFSSFLYAYDFEFYDTGIPINSLDHSILNMLSFPHLVNNFLLAVIIQLYLVVFGLVLKIFVHVVYNVEVIDNMDNPLFSATSVSDFWSKKWNLVIHDVLKRGVFRPARIYFSSNIAAVCTFVASGLFHEWIISIIFYNGDQDENGNCESCYQPTYGRQAMFFCWFAIVLNIEYLIVRYFPNIHRIFQNLPATVILFFVLMTGVPVAHWFTGDMVMGQYFHQCQISLPTFVLMNKKE